MGNNSNSTKDNNSSSTKDKEYKYKNYSFQLVIVGNFEVGKTNFLSRYVDDNFSKNYIPSFGLDWKTKSLNFLNKEITLRITVADAHERFGSILESYYKRAHGIIFIYDVTNKDSFDAICNWNKVVQNNACCKVLVGNKCDKYDRVVTEEMGKNLADELCMNFFETSAKTGKNIKELFFSLTEEMFKTFYPEDLQNLIRSSIEEEIKEQALNYQILDNNFKESFKCQYDSKQIDILLEKFIEKTNIQDSYFEKLISDDYCFNLLRKYEKDELTKYFESNRSKLLTLINEKVNQIKNYSNFKENIIKILQLENADNIYLNKIKNKILRINEDINMHKIEYLTIMVVGKSGVGK